MTTQRALEQRRTLRRAMRARRSALTTKERANTARAVARLIEGAGWLKPGQRIALYLATAEEIHCAPLIERALRRRCKLFLPKITSYRQRRMRFAPMTDRYRLNRYGIAEPDGRRTVTARQLQRIFIPLVAFDAHGERLGMGGGYYDRALQHRLWQSCAARPLIIGIAHSCQRVAELSAWPTDVPMDAVVTERGIERFAAGQ
jgi:5-formyltetrahydrofolate cyclo-ligase